MSREIVAVKVVDAASREAALGVVEEVYAREKQWIEDVPAEIPPGVWDSDRQSWFLALVDGQPAGVIRLVYDPSLELPAESGVLLEPGIDLEAYAQGKRFVDIGRFMIRPGQRHDMRLALRLMHTAAAEVVARGYTHFVTDVFESDRHSPLGFHLRVLGFEQVGTHRFGELRCTSVRVILVLDIARAYRRLQRQKSKLSRELASGLDDAIAALPMVRTA